MHLWGAVGRPGSVSNPTYMAKNEFLLNEYLGIFMHFESILCWPKSVTSSQKTPSSLTFWPPLYFFMFLNLENGLFQTHPPTKSGNFQISFFNPSLMGVFSAFLEAKKHFFPKVLKKWSSIQKKQKIFYHFLGGGQTPK